MNKICLIYQPCGLGDILFCLKIAHHYAHRGFQIIWPVIQEYEFLDFHIPWINWISWGDINNKLTHRDKLPDNIKFPKKEFYNPESHNIITNDFVFFNGFYNDGSHGPIMAKKYKSIGLDYTDWAEYISWRCNYNKEQELAEKLQIDIDKPDYVFINRNYQMRPKIEVCNQISNNPEDYGARVVEMQVIPGFSIFDWLPIIAGAKSIKMVETSLCYLLEARQMRDKITKDLSLFSRHRWFGEVDYLFKLPWKYNI